MDILSEVFNDQIYAIENADKVFDKNVLISQF